MNKCTHNGRVKATSQILYNQYHSAKMGAVVQPKYPKSPPKNNDDRPNLSACASPKVKDFRKKLSLSVRSLCKYVSKDSLQPEESQKNNRNRIKLKNPYIFGLSLFPHIRIRMSCQVFSKKPFSCFRFLPKNFCFMSKICNDQYRSFFYLST